jgi:hypothetical protein
MTLKIPGVNPEDPFAKPVAFKRIQLREQSNLSSAAATIEK